MSFCIKDIYDYDLVKKCRVCKNVSLKSIFLKNKTKRDGLNSECASCCKENYMNNSVKLIQKQKTFYLKNRDQMFKYHRKYKRENRDKINFYGKNRRDPELIFKLAHTIRVRNNKAFKSQNLRKTNKTFDLLVCSNSFFKSWIIHQLYGDMSLDNYGSVWQIDHSLPLTSFNLLDENDMKKCSNWIILRHMYSKENNSKNDKIDHYLYLCQEVKAKFFMKLNEEGLSEDLH